VKRLLTWILGAMAAATAVAALAPKRDRAPAAPAPDGAAPGTAVALAAAPDAANAAMSFGKRIAAEVKKDNTTMVAAGLAYYAMLAIFPALIAAISIYALVLDPATLTDDLASVAEILPESTYTIIEDQMRQIASSSPSGLGFGVALSILATLWTASGGTKALMKGLNIVYDVDEDRPFLHQRAIAYAMTLGLIVFVVTAASLVTFVPGWLAELGLERETRTLIEWTRWPGIFLVVVLGLGLLYKIAPNRPASRSKWLNPGALVAAVLWVVATLGFSFYTSNLGSFNATYGALGGVVVLLFWFFISGFVILLGAEVNAQLERGLRPVS
jgi:membrane protein